MNPPNVNISQIPFIPARFFTAVPLDAPRHPRVIVLHSMEAPDKPGTALGVGHYFQTLQRPASAHYGIDPTAVYQYVQCKDVAYGAPGCNRIGIHLEHAGYARETFADWTSIADSAELTISAYLAAKVLMPKFDIPARWLTAADFDNINDPSVMGFTTHLDITTYLNPGNGHTDPGVNFPRDLYLSWVEAYSNG